MAELREVFEMVTKQAEPDLDSWKQQEKRQRRSSRNQKLGALVVAAAIAVVAVVVVIRAGGEGTGTRPGGQPTGMTQIPPLPWGALEPGRYAISITSDPAQDYSPWVTIDVPKGYEGLGGWAVLKPGTSQTGLSVWAIGRVYADACMWSGTKLPPSTVGSADRLSAALASQQGLRVSTPTDVTVDGFAGTYMERTVPAGSKTFRCDQGELPRVVGHRGGAVPRGVGSARSPVDPRRRWRSARSRCLARAKGIGAGPSGTGADDGVYPDRSSLGRQRGGRARSAAHPISPPGRR